MPFIIRFPLYFIINYFILCLPIAEEPIFHHLYRWTGPYFSELYSTVIETGDSIVQKGKELTKNLFNEERPIQEQREDSVKSYYSSARPGEENLHNSYSKKDKKSLHQIFNKHNKTKK